MLTVIVSATGADDVFLCEDRLNNRNYSFQITTTLINHLHALEDAYQNHLIPIIGSSEEEAAAHTSKLETDQMVDAGHFAYGSSEYYGSWAVNFYLSMRLVEEIDRFIDYTTKVYTVYMILTMIFTPMINRALTLSADQYKSAASQVDDIADQLTNNKESSKVMLGTDADNVSWHAEGQRQNMTYFYSENWDTYVAQYGKDKMSAANKQFLSTQKAAGKQFYFSHNPMDTLQYYPNSDFAMELNWLRDSYGLTELTSDNFIPYGNYWVFRP